MGAINTIWNPEYWKISLQGKSKLIEGDIIYKMIIGSGEDFCYYEIVEFISKENYENVLNGKYFIKSFPYSELPILLFDEQYQLISLIKGSKIIYDKLSQIQTEYISNLNNKKKILKKHA